MIVKNLLSLLRRPGCLCLHLYRYGTAVERDILKLHDRGVFQGIFPVLSAPDLAIRLATPQSVYCGFDPTADSLHIGNLLAIVALIHCQRAGHTPIALVGGATGHIGDPSGKTKERETIDAETVEKNILGLTENLDRIFLNHELFLWKDSKGRQLETVKILNNHDWYKDRNIIEFLSSVGRYFRMGPMLSKHSVKARLKSTEGMSFIEFTYQIFQAYDWLHLMKNHDCYIQIGGNDQTGNISAGIDFVERAVNQRVYGLTLPLLTTSGGVKIGKSEGNAIWLDPNKTSPFDLYQHFIKTKDSDVEMYLRLFTFIPDADIHDIFAKHKLKPEKRKAQRILSEKILLLVHGEEGLLEAQRWTAALFSDTPESLLHLSDTDMQKLFKTSSTTSLLFQHDLTLKDLLLKCKCFNSEVDAITKIEAGAVHINHCKITSPDYLLTLGEHIMPNNTTLIRIGRKKYHIVNWIDLKEEER